MDGKSGGDYWALDGRPRAPGEVRSKEHNRKYRRSLVYRLVGLCCL
jgi:hypothetical protein